MRSKTSVRFVDSWASVHFDRLRGAAALLVLLEHARNLLLVDYPSVRAHRGWMALPYGLAAAGHQAVVLFFVLSGYFIGGTVFRSVERDQWEWGGYLLRRVVRLWIVLLPTLLLCLMWDRLGMGLGHAPALYAGRVPNHMLGDTARLLAPRVFFGNLFFVQGIYTPLFGTDGALWSLANEFWYYLLFPLAMIAGWRRRGWRERAVCGVLFLLTAAFVHAGILASFPIWLAGAALFKLKAPSFSEVTGRRVRIVATVIYFPILVALSRVYAIPPLLSDYLLTVLTMLYLWLLLSHGEPYRARDLGVRGSREMARFSYSLYAAHTPVLVFAASLLLGDRRWYPNAGTLLAVAGLMAGTLAYAYLLASVTEFRTDAVRMRLERLLGMAVERPALSSDPVEDRTPAQS